MYLNSQTTTSEYFPTKCDRLNGLKFPLYKNNSSCRRDFYTTYKDVFLLISKGKVSKDTPKATPKRNLPVFVIYNHVSFRGLKIQYHKHGIRQGLSSTLTHG